jgi:hypothetical protein
MTWWRNDRMRGQSTWLLITLAACAATPAKQPARRPEPLPSPVQPPAPIAPDRADQPDLVKPEPEDPGEPTFETDRNPRGGFLAELAADFHAHLELPAGLHGTATGCVRVVADGTITETLIRGEPEPRGRQAVERALADLKAARQRNPVAVPARELTQKWLCFRIDFDHLD